jgi:chromosome segregation ATPase
MSALPRLANNLRQNGPQSFALSAIRSDMLRMQQALVRTDETFSEYLSDIPLRLPETLAAAQKSITAIQGKVEQKHLQTFQSRLSSLTTQLAKLRSDFAAHTQFTQEQVKADSFQYLIPTLQQNVARGNALLLSDCERLLAQKLAGIEAETDTKSEGAKVDPFELHAQFDDAETPPDLVEHSPPEPLHQLTGQLEQHHRRISELEFKADIAAGRDRIIVPADLEEAINGAKANHRRLRMLRIRSELLRSRVAHPPPPPREARQRIAKPTEQPVTGQEFYAFVSEFSGEYQAIMHQLATFISRSHKRIQTLTERVDEAEKKVESFEKAVERLNKMMVKLSDDIDQVDEEWHVFEDENGEELELQVKIDAMVKDYRNRIIDLRTWIRSEVERLRKRLEKTGKEVSVSG